MKKIQSVSLAVLFLSALVWTAGRTLLSLPDWAVRANGVIMLAAMALLVFASARRKLKGP